MLTARDYFANSGWNDVTEGYSSACYPLPESCGHDYVILVTDGLPSVDSAGNNVSGAGALTDAANAAAALMTSGVKTYVVGFAMPFGTDPTALDQLALAGGTNSALLASDPASLSTALLSIFDTIKKETSTAAALAANSTRLDSTGSGDTTYIYQAKFNSADWSGSLTAFPLATNGVVLAEAWSTDDVGVIPSNLTRNIYTWNGTTGLEFTSGNFSLLDSAQQTDLIDVNRLNWLRGTKPWRMELPTEFGQKYLEILLIRPRLMLVSLILVMIPCLQLIPGQVFTMPMLKRQGLGHPCFM